MHFRTCSVAALASIGSVLVALGLYQASPVAQTVRFSGPTSSQPLALSAGGELLAVVNPDNDSVTFFDVAGGVNANSAKLRLVMSRTASRSRPTDQLPTSRTPCRARYPFYR